MLLPSIVSFNSILVRLKALVEWVVVGGGTWFQFHTGSIKSLGDLVSFSVGEQCFNSILVRLKAKIRHLRLPVPYLVSIPYWFD